MQHSISRQNVLLLHDTGNLNYLHNLKILKLILNINNLNIFIFVKLGINQTISKGIHDLFITRHSRLPQASERCFRKTPNIPPSCTSDFF